MQFGWFIYSLIILMDPCPLSTPPALNNTQHLIIYLETHEVICYSEALLSIVTHCSDDYSEEH
jgi:hypothetical protein